MNMQLTLIISVFFELDKGCRFFFEKKAKNIWSVRRKVIPLHPQMRNQGSVLWLSVLLDKF